MIADPLCPRLFLQSCAARSNFLPRFLGLKKSLSVWGSSEVGMKSSFLSDGSPVMKRAFHSPRVGSEQRAATKRLEGLWQVLFGRHGPSCRFLCLGAGKAERVSTLCKGGWHSGWSPWRGAQQQYQAAPELGWASVERHLGRGMGHTVTSTGVEGCRIILHRLSY